MSILEVTGQIILLPPFYENFGKRIIKSPKLYFTDSGLACHFLGIKRLTLLEAKATRTPKPSFSQPITQLGKCIVDYRMDAFLVHSGKGPNPTALSPGVKAIGLDGLSGIL